MSLFTLQQPKPQDRPFSAFQTARPISLPTKMFAPIVTSGAAGGTNAVGAQQGANPNSAMYHAMEARHDPNLQWRGPQQSPPIFHFNPNPTSMVIPPPPPPGSSSSSSASQMKPSQAHPPPPPPQFMPPQQQQQQPWMFLPPFVMPNHPFPTSSAAPPALSVAGNTAQPLHQQLQSLTSVQAPSQQALAQDPAVAAALQQQQQFAMAMANAMMAVNSNNGANGHQQQMFLPTAAMGLNSNVLSAIASSADGMSNLLDATGLAKSRKAVAAQSDHRKKNKKQRRRRADDQDDEEDTYATSSSVGSEEEEDMSKSKRHPHRRRSSVDGDEAGSNPSEGKGTPPTRYVADRPRRSTSNSSAGLGPVPAAPASTDPANDDAIFAEYNGEQRLVIDFDDLGTVTSPPERLGKKGLIPDGLSGSFMMYSERWFFAVKFVDEKPTVSGNSAPGSPQTSGSGEGEAKEQAPAPAPTRHPHVHMHRCIEWKVKNEAWDNYHCLVENQEDALRRNTRGVTLCNKVFTEAMEMRAKEFQLLLNEEKSKPEPDPFQISFFENRMNAFRPKRFSEGPLLFGLRHKIVQRRAFIMADEA